MHIEHYHSTSPYPTIDAGEKNRSYALAMLSNIGASNSEMSAVSLYFYNNLIADQQPDIAKAFHEIMIVEMHHLDIYGKLALQLGANPRLWTAVNNKMKYWTPAYNHYPTELRPLVVNALNGELTTIAKYEQQAREIRNQNVVENIKRIIQDEQIHVEIFKQMLEELDQK